MPKKQLHPTPVPTWLLNANASTKFNPTDVLQGSIYYPCCYVDGHPLQAYGGFAHSFVYVDYHCDKETILQAIPRIAGYEPLFTQEITQEELSPQPQVKVFLRRSDFYPPSLDEPIDEMIKRTQHGADPKGGDDQPWQAVCKPFQEH